MFDDKLNRVPAEVAQRTLQKPDGSTEPAWVVSAVEEGGPCTVVFSGFDAAPRAITYARANYFPCHFVMQADPGQYSHRGNSAEMHNGNQSRN